MLTINKMTYFSAIAPAIIFCNLAFSGFSQDSTCMNDLSTAPIKVMIKKLPHGAALIKIQKPDRFSGLHLRAEKRDSNKVFIFFVPGGLNQSPPVTYDSQTALYSQEFSLNQPDLLNDASSITLPVKSHCFSTGTSNNHQPEVLYSALNEQDFFVLYQSDFHNW